MDMVDVVYMSDSTRPMLSVDLDRLLMDSKTYNSKRRAKIILDRSACDSQSLKAGASGAP